MRSATTSARGRASDHRWTSSARMCACTPILPSARPRSTSIPPASRCSSAAGGATPTPLRYARISPLASLRSPAGFRRRPLLDPMCGSGTLAIEAAPHRERSRAGTGANVRLPEARVVRRADLAAHSRQRARDRVRPAPPAPTIYASDHDPRAIAQCRANAAHAGIADWITVEEGDVLSRAAPAPAGLLLANPPYGVRLDDDARLAAFYPQLGDALKQHFAGWTAYLFTGDLRLARLIGPQAFTQDTALQRQHRVPAVPLRPRRGPSAADVARGIVADSR